ncbi:unnamed protein product [Rotaria sordida]|uniref:Uncharacterized protein n=2 Tax=Rotaria sordida TaxID=392033 RepID=A0A814KX09_9BILA|nr:unnamed protein product [Rotaria sordida]CAF1384084.1 unnamed protein product [Rotaria sordida]
MKFSVVICFLLITCCTSNPTTTPNRLRSRNYAGCDALIDSCGPNGACCDIHDDCYAKNKCTRLSWIIPSSIACTKCNTDVVKCIATEDPGPSRCCQNGGKCCGSRDENCLKPS